MYELEKINPYKIHKQLFDLKEFLEEIRADFSEFIKEDQAKKSQFNFEIDPSIDHDNLIYSDKFKLKLIISHLIDHAVKSNLYHQIDIKATRRIIMMELSIYVNYTSNGIKDTKSKKDKVNYNEKKMDIDFIEKVMNLLDGTFSFQIIESKGYLAKLTIPSKINKDNNINIEHNYKTNDYNWYGKKILVVDDEEANFFLTQHFLEKTGASFEWAKDGKEGIELAIKNDYNLILMDLRMPNIDGFEATKTIKKHKPYVPIIIQTAHTLFSEKQKAYEAGCNEYFSKPLIISDFLYKLDSYINK